MTASASESNAKASDMEFRPDWGFRARIVRTERPVVPLFRTSGRTLGVRCEQSPLGDEQIGQAKERVELGGVPALCSKRT